MKLFITLICVLFVSACGEKDSPLSSEEHKAVENYSGFTKEEKAKIERGESIVEPYHMKEIPPPVYDKKNSAL